MLIRFIQGTKEFTWELWVLKGNEVQEHQYSDSVRKESLAPLVSPIELSKQLSPAVDEYQTLLAVTQSRGAAYFPDAGSEIAEFHRALAEQLKRLPVHEIRKLQWLINVNAALSRYSSQTFSGTAPILGMECHFWTHSLLGIGIATKALVNIRRFVESAAKDAALTGRLLTWGDHAATSRKLGAISSIDAYWKMASLPIHLSEDKKNDRPAVPLIVYYSGRDGFKSTTFTLSAPLEILHSANTFAWSLQTITHELSHVFVERIITQIIGADIESEVWAKKIVAIENRTKNAQNMLERVQELLIEACGRLEHERLNMKVAQSLDLSPEDLPQIISLHFQEVSEVLSHIFDYIHFYNQNKNSYVQSIWCSWDVIPNIKNRVQGYITRSLCSLMFTNFTEVGGFDVSVKELIDSLTSLGDIYPQSQYIKYAILELKGRTDVYKNRVQNRIFLIKLAKVCISCPQTVEAFSREFLPIFSGGLSQGGQRLNFYSDQVVSNPLAFLREASVHEEPQASVSLWILTQLALAEVDFE